MKKFKKIILYNIVILFFVFCIIELLSYVSLCHKYSQEIKSFIFLTEGREIKIPMLKYKKVTVPKEELLENFRPVEYRENTPPRRDIILFGCSFTYGFGLEENQTFSKKLADYTQRTVYNRGLSGTGIPFMYFQLSNDKIVKELPDNPEYIIFTLIPDHFPRLFRYRNWVMSGDHTLRYKLSKNGNLEEDKSIFLPVHSLFTSIVLEEYIANKKQNDEKSVFALSDKLILESNRLIKNNFKDTKFVILYIRNPLDLKNGNDFYIEHLKKSLENNNIIFIDINKNIPELNNNEQYWLEDKDHPSEKAWDLIVPFLSKKLKLI